MNFEITVCSRFLKNNKFKRTGGVQVFEHLMLGGYELGMRVLVTCEAVYMSRFFNKYPPT